MKSQSSKAYQELRHFIEEKMSMQHIYQPVIIKHLLSTEGMASIENITKTILDFDVSQYEYYKRILSTTPNKVLTKHNIARYSKGVFTLDASYSNLTDEEKQELIQSCDEQLQCFLDKPENTPFEHRSKASGFISGSVRYKVLARAKGRCEACGISNDERAFDVDHIIPRSKGGTDEPSNLQALCFQCNREKRDTDDTDYIAVKKSYDDRDNACVFCNIEPDRIIADNELAFAISDGYPVTEYHTLFIPKRHVSDYFDLYAPEVNAINQLIKQEKDKIKALDKTVTGFNVGINVGSDAGQTVFHVHVHLIPRRKGDMLDPKGGVRGVIPGKQKY